MSEDAKISGSSFPRTGEIQLRTDLCSDSYMMNTAMPLIERLSEPYKESEESTYWYAFEKAMLLYFNRKVASKIPLIANPRSIWGKLKRSERFLLQTKNGAMDTNKTL